MEIIKKTILQAITTGTTSGCTDNCHIIIPDLNAIYYMKISLTHDAVDMGFFDVEPFLQTSTNTLVIESNGTGMFDVISNMKWKINNTSNWLTIDKFSGFGENTITITPQINTSIDSRTTTLKVYNDAFVKFVEVIQMGADGSYDYGGYNYSLSLLGDDVSVVIIEPIGVGNLI